MPFDAAQTAPALRPGERMLAGRPYIFDQNALNAFLAVEALRNAPADLTKLSDEDLQGLFYASVAKVPVDLIATAKRVCDEWHSRPSVSGSYTGKAA